MSRKPATYALAVAEPERLSALYRLPTPRLAQSWASLVSGWLATFGVPAEVGCRGCQVSLELGAPLARPGVRELDTSLALAEIFRLFAREAEAHLAELEALLRRDLAESVEEPPGPWGRPS
ncbi:MAG TPA: hypothetical protein PK413_07655 [Thermoanaerobaculia bacterium]|nr:hypothetical protein [Thermoanaerobaculia bacterium]